MRCGCQWHECSGDAGYSRKAYILLNVEAELDTQNGQQAMAAMQAADLVVALSAYKHQAAEYADVLLPIAPFTETSGTFVSSEGRVQSFKGAVRPLGEARPRGRCYACWATCSKWQASIMKPVKRCATKR